jgi:type IV secretion system protein VirB9
VRANLGCAAPFAFLLASLSVHGAETPAPGANDPRVRFVTYKADEVTVVTVQRGAVTRLVLSDDEHIAAAATGYAADCQKPELEWCVRADVGSNQIWVKPKDNATNNNLEVKTDKRDYSFEFQVLKDPALGRDVRHALRADPMYRVIFRYPLRVPPMPANLAMGAAVAAPAASPVDDKNVVTERLASAKPQPRNWSYSMQVLPGGEEISPTLVFDDGRFTYFKFPANREVPSIFYIAPDGEEQRLNFHVEGDVAVIQRMGRRFVLRLGQSVVGVWNDAFDLDGVAPVAGVTVDGVSRELR